MTSRSRTRRACSSSSCPVSSPSRTVIRRAMCGKISVAMHGDACDWCGERIGPDDGFRAAEPAGERVAAFCRLEHVVPWAIQGARWNPGAQLEPLPASDELERCALCGEPSGEAPV